MRFQLDFTQQQNVFKFMQAERRDCILIAAAKVGDIHANSLYRVDFTYTNMVLVCRVVHRLLRLR